MNDNNKSSKMLSDDALERVMLDMFGGAWSNPNEKEQPAHAEMDSPRQALNEETEGEI
jgi:hypothetical protein